VRFFGEYCHESAKLVMIGCEMKSLSTLKIWYQQEPQQQEHI